MTKIISKTLAESDTKINDIINRELERQELGLELIASENYASKSVMQAQGSILTNKYAEGYPSKRYYGGCEFVDQIESIAIERVKELFKCQFANVQAHSGSQANMAAYFSLIKPGDKIMGMDLSQGGHLTHGSPVNFSGKLYTVASYGLDSKTERIDYESVRSFAKKERPQLIIAGASAYSREIDFSIFREIADEIGAYLLVDMAHIAGLVAAGLHPSPIPHAHIVTSTTHKTLRGPRGGIVLTNDEELAKKINFNVFPGLQGGPFEHVIAAKAVAFKEALEEDFKTYQKNVLKNAKTLALSLTEHGFDIVSQGTDNHLVLVKTDSFGLSGKELEKSLEGAHITCNKNMIPNDTRSPFVTSGIRLGTPAITTRKMNEEHMRLIAAWIADIAKHPEDEKTIEKVKGQVIDLCKDYPVY